MSREIQVGIADMKITRAPGSLITYALGSCIGVCIYDPAIQLAGMVHIMLPNTQSVDAGNIFKYADTGIPEMLRKMAVFGGISTRMVAKIAGGAKMFDIPGDSTLGNIGERNAEMVKRVLQNNRIRLLHSDVGSNYARTMVFDAVTGQVTIRSYGRTELRF